MCCFGDVPAAHALDLLSSLIDKSLVIKEDVAGAACYRLHETMREYARLKLREAGEEDAVERRCADYYLSRCAHFAAEGRYRLLDWLAWTELEIDNIRAVLRRCLDHEDSQRGIDLATCLIWYWITRATAEGVRWLDELLARHGRRPPRTRGRTSPAASSPCCRTIQRRPRPRSTRAATVARAARTAGSAVRNRSPWRRSPPTWPVTAHPRGGCSTRPGPSPTAWMTWAPRS